MSTGRGKFFHGRRPSSELVDLTVENNHLVIANGSTVLGRWPIKLIFRDPTHSVAVVIGCGSDDERVELLDNHLYSLLPGKKSVWSTRDLKSKRSHIYLWGLGSVFFITLILLNTSLITKFIVNRVPLEYESKLGELISENAQWQKCELNPAQQAAVTKIMDALYLNKPPVGERVALHWVSEVLDNAYTLPGGSVFVFKGLLKEMKSPDELAGVLSHEIEHAERRHILQSVIKGLTLTALLNFAFGDASAVILIDPSTAAQILSLRLNRDMEYEADKGALKRLDAAGISPLGMVDFFKRIHEEGIKDRRLTFLSSHPFTEDRKAFFERAAPESKKDLPPVLSEAEWNEVRTICDEPI